MRILQLHCDSIEYTPTKKEIKSAKDLSAKLKDMILVSRLITYSAYMRKESRGAHFRSDYPKSNEKFLFRKKITLKEMQEFLNKKEYIEKVA